MLSERQELLLNFLVKSYIGSAEPVSSDLLKKTARLDISPATVRNDLQELTKQGYLEQPHPSAGRVPTKKAYQYFVESVADNEAVFISQQIQKARKEIEAEMRLAEELMHSLGKLSSSLQITQITENGELTEILEIISFSKNSHSKNQQSINEIIKGLEQF